MPEKCTRLSLISQAALLAQFEEGLSQDEEEQARGFFDQYLLPHPGQPPHLPVYQLLQSLGGAGDKTHPLETQ